MTHNVWLQAPSQGTLPATAPSTAATAPAAGSDGGDGAQGATRREGVPGGNRGAPFRLAAAPLSAVASNTALRADPKYRLHWGARGGALYPESTVPLLPLYRLTHPLRRRKLRKGVLADPCLLVELEDVEQRTGVIASAEEVETLGSDKLLFGDADVLTTRLRPNLGKTIRNDPAQRMAGTTEWIPIRVDATRLHPILLKYYLLSPGYVDHAAGLLSGKEHPRVAEADVLALHVPVPPAAEQGRLVATLEVIEAEMAVARAELARPDAIIDEVIGGAFSFDTEAYAVGRATERARVFVRPTAAAAASFALRSSAAYHDPGFEPIAAFWRRTPSVRLRTQVAVPVRLGATVTRAQLQDEGEVCYVHPGATKHQGVVSPDDCYRVSDAFYSTHRRRFGLARGDVIVNRSGQAIGKVALWDDPAPALASDFTMRVRFGPDMDARFAWYSCDPPCFRRRSAANARGVACRTCSRRSSAPCGSPCARATASR